MCEAGCGREGGEGGVFSVVVFIIVSFVSIT